MFYVYALLDPRKPGPFKYGRWKFEYEPFYIGKGKANRAFKHFEQTIDTCKNLHKVRKIAKIRRETGEEPILAFKRSGLSEDDAHQLEISLIRRIGRSDLKRGPLTNLTDGGEGTSCRKFSRKSREKMRESRYLVIDRMSPEEQLSQRRKMLKSPALYKAEFTARWPSVIIQTPYVDVHTALTFRCKACRHKWSGKPSYAKLNGCPNCRKLDPAKIEAERQRRSDAVKQVHATRSKQAKRKIAERISKAQVASWSSGDHCYFRKSTKEIAAINKKKSESAKRFCLENPDKKHLAAVNGWKTRSNCT